jgi:hypothetical protein
MMTRNELLYALLDGLHEAESGLLFAGADKKIRRGTFVPAPTLALRKVREVIATAKEHGIARAAVEEAE